MEELNLGTVEELMITYISSLLPFDLKERIIEILREFKDYFDWNYDEMPGLDRSLVEHRLPINSVKVFTWSSTPFSNHLEECPRR